MDEQLWRCQIWIYDRGRDRSGRRRDRTIDEREQRTEKVVDREKEGGGGGQGQTREDAAWERGR